MLDGATLGDLLKKLTAKHQAFEEVLFDPTTHQLKGPVGIVINNQLAQSLQDLNTILKDGDTVMLLPFIDGG
jgi:molybdopterin converting factor small subunit